MTGAAGVGIDLTDVKRIKSLRERYGDAFLERTFCDFEIDYCKKFKEPDSHFAARFAAKEAMAKALGTGFSGDITLKSLGVKNGESGEPVAVLDDAAKARLKQIGAEKILVSISHLKDYAQAIAIAVK